MNAIIETGISLILIFFIFSTITYIIQELIAVNMKYRSKMLWKAMSQLFDDNKNMLEGRMALNKAIDTTNTTGTNEFYKHVQIASLQKDLKRRPNYIPAANFALAVMDLVAKQAPASVKQNKLFEDFKAGLQTFSASNGNLYEVLKTLAATSDTVKELQYKIETWFNNYMQRVTGWYKSHTVLTVRLIAIAVALIFNINVIKLAKTIYKNGELRTAMVTMAQSVVDNSQPITQYYTKTFESEYAAKIADFTKRIDSVKKTDSANAGAVKAIEVERDTVMAALAKTYTGKNISAIKSLTDSLKTAGLPLGWNKAAWKEVIDCKNRKNNFNSIFLAIIGLLIGAGCISMGAPFWFDLLNKLVNVRSSGLKPPK